MTTGTLMAAQGVEVERGRFEEATDDGDDGAGVLGAQHLDGLVAGGGGEGGHGLGHGGGAGEAEGLDRGGERGEHLQGFHLGLGGLLAGAEGAGA